MTAGSTTEASGFDPATIDVCDPRFYDDPWDAYRYLRDEAPVFWDAKSELWVVSRYEDVSHVSRHDEMYSAAQGVRPQLAVPLSIISMDDPEHTRQRRLINRAFTPKVVRRLSDHIRDLSNQMIDKIARDGSCEFVEDIAVHVPMIVIAELMGLDPEQRMRLYHWSEDMIAGDGVVDPDSPVLQKATTAFVEFAAMCNEIIEQRRTTGDTSDLIGILTNAFDQGALAREAEWEAERIETTPLSNDELFMFLCLLVVAGNETTRNALSGGLLAFSRFPEEREKLLANPDLMDGAVEEIVRYVSPVLCFTRTVKEDHEFHGARFRAGQKVLMLYQSANRDPRAFDDPDAFRIDRDGPQHLGFGIGTHYCLGANLARAEIRVVFEELFHRLRDIRAQQPHAPLERGDSTLVLSLRRVPAVFTPEA